MAQKYKISADGRLVGRTAVLLGMTLDNPSDYVDTPPPDESPTGGQAWCWTGAAWEPRDVPVAQEPVVPPVTRNDLLSALAALRYRVEVSGTSLGGVRILTGRTDQAMTTQAYITLKFGMVAGIDWKGPEGWRRVTLTELEPVARAVAAHVQRCFSAELVVSEQIATADPQTFDLSAAWAAAWSATA